MRKMLTYTQSTVYEFSYFDSEQATTLDNGYSRGFFLVAAAPSVTAEDILTEVNKKAGPDAPRLPWDQSLESVYGENEFVRAHLTAQGFKNLTLRIQEQHPEYTELDLAKELVKTRDGAPK